MFLAVPLTFERNSKHLCSRCCEQESWIDVDPSTNSSTTDHSVDSQAILFGVRSFPCDYLCPDGICVYIGHDYEKPGRETFLGICRPRMPLTALDSSLLSSGVGVYCWSKKALVDGL